MHASSRRTVLFATLAVVVPSLYTAPAGALGRSSAPSTKSPVVQTVERLGRIEAEQKTMTAALHSQVEALRQEVADLKARVERQDFATAD